MNLVWGKLMVVGLVEPYDGFDLLRLDPNNPPPAPWTIQPTNPWLLDELAKAGFGAYPTQFVGRFAHLMSIGEGV